MNQDQWIEADLGVDHRIESVVTQGAVDADTGIEYYVDRFDISFKPNEMDSFNYFGRFSVSSGSRVTTSPAFAFLARYVRIQPTRWNADQIVLRWELNGYIGK